MLQGQENILSRVRSAKMNRDSPGYCQDCLQPWMTFEIHMHHYVRKGKFQYNRAHTVCAANSSLEKKHAETNILSQTLIRITSNCQLLRVF